MGNTHGIAAFIAFTGVLTVGCALALRETNPAEIRADPDAVPGSHLYHGGVRQ